MILPSASSAGREREREEGAPQWAMARFRKENQGKWNEDEKSV